MTSIAPSPRSRLSVAALALGSLLALGGLARAAEGDPCKKDGNGVAVPQCETVTHQNSSLSHDRTEGIQIQCPADAPYYWSGWSDTFTSKWHVITENLLVEAATHANFTVSSTQATGSLAYSVTIGCSPVPIWGTCTKSSIPVIVADPKCPMGPKRQDCTGAPYPKCWDTWTETCTSGSTVQDYSCTDANPLKTTCVTCSG
jgi:hypothetical protein